MHYEEEWGRNNNTLISERKGENSYEQETNKGPEKCFKNSLRQSVSLVRKIVSTQCVITGYLHITSSENGFAVFFVRSGHIIHVQV